MRLHLLPSLLLQTKLKRLQPQMTRSQCLLYQAPGLWNYHHCTELTLQAMRAAGLKPAEGSFAESYAQFVEMCVKDATE